MSVAEQHWAGKGGDAYVRRQPEERLVLSYKAMWNRVFAAMKYVPESVLEIGANVGLNLDAIRQINPRVEATAMEINPNAQITLLGKGYQIWDGDLAELKHMAKVELAFTRGVLIHVPPTELAVMYERLYRASAKYIVVAEYYNPTPVEIEYRGQMGLLWKRDFAGEMLNRFPDLRLVDYGFVYHRDRWFPQDDVTYFLMEKEST